MKCVVSQNKADGRYEGVSAECWDWTSKHKWRKEMDSSSNIHELWGTLIIIISLFRQFSDVPVHRAISLIVAQNIFWITIFKKQYLRNADFKWQHFYSKVHNFEVVFHDPLLSQTYTLIPKSTLVQKHHVSPM